MTADSTPTEQTAVQAPDVPPQGEGGKQKRPVVWMILAGRGDRRRYWARRVLGGAAQRRPERHRGATRGPDRCGRCRPRPRPRIALRMPVRASRQRSPTSLGVVVVSDEDVAEARSRRRRRAERGRGASGRGSGAGDVEQARAERDLAEAEAEQARAGETARSRAVCGCLARCDEGASRERRGRGR